MLLLVLKKRLHISRSLKIHQTYLLILIENVVHGATAPSRVDTRFGIIGAFCGFDVSSKIRLLIRGGPKYPFTRIWACARRDVLVSRGYTALWLDSKSVCVAHWNSLLANHAQIVSTNPGFQNGHVIQCNAWYWNTCTWNMTLLFADLWLVKSCTSPNTCEPWTPCVIEYNKKQQEL